MQIRPSNLKLRNFDISERISRIARYEQWRAPMKIDFPAIIGHDAWEHYWSLCENVVAEMRQGQDAATAMKRRIDEAMAKSKGY